MQRGTKLVPTTFLEDALAQFRKDKHLCEQAMSQLSDDDFFRLLDPNANSVALLVKHMAGNMRSRWRDFLTSDGEKPDRHRDTEFEILKNDSRDSLMSRWEAGWQFVFSALEPLTDQDITRIIYIRSEPHTVLQAINRQLTHYAHHGGQILLLAKHWRGDQWASLSVPKGQSEEFNQMMLTARYKKSVIDKLR